MPRAKIWGFLAITLSLLTTGCFVYFGFISEDTHAYMSLPKASFAAIAVPISLVAYAVLITGFWIGYTILTIKVVPPMPEIVEKRDYSKIQAFFLCLATLTLMGLLGYGIYIQSFWALAVPAAVISLVILGAILWVGVAILTTRTTLPEEK